MRVRALRLTDFRTYEDISISFAEGAVALVGANGQGKTNVVEAIAYLATLSSHRVSSDAPLVRQGAERAVIGADISKGDRSVVVEVEINPGKANRARINRASATRARDVLGIVKCIVFAPEDLALVKSDPSERRAFLDNLLVQRNPRLQATRADYDRILKQRNALLKSSHVSRRGSREATIATLSIWDDQLIAAGGEIVAMRLALIDDLRRPLTEHYARIAGGEAAVSSSDVTIEYAPGYSLADALDMAGGLEGQERRDACADALRDAIELRREDELDRGVTLVGPHRDDLAIHLGSLPAKGYASHGESWSIALALKLASMDILRDEGDDPILILDDVFAELDTKRRQALVDSVADVEQVIITAAVAEDIPSQWSGQRWSVTRGSVEQVTA